MANDAGGNSASAVADRPSHELGEVVLELTRVSQRFGGVRAVDDVSLEVRGSSVHGLIGPNGAGKTTLFDAVAGLRTPTSGRIVFRGRDVTNATAVKRARLGIRRTFQRQQPIGWLTVAENVQAALDWHGGGGGTLADLLALPPRRRLDRERRLLVDEALELCGLIPLANERAGLLPIAQARLVELARACVDGPTVLLLDEPTSGLGEAEAAITANVIRHMRSKGTAVLLVEHDMPFVMAMCDVITVLELGTVIAQGTPEEVQSDEAVRLAYLG
jgi:ABC-type branched-subunit amino acid transport system ATPase component